MAYKIILKVSNIYFILLLIMSSFLILIIHNWGIIIGLCYVAYIKNKCKKEIELKMRIKNIIKKETWQKNCQVSALLRCDYVHLCIKCDILTTYWLGFIGHVFDSSWPWTRDKIITSDVLMRLMNRKVNNQTTVWTLDYPRFWQFEVWHCQSLLSTSTFMITNVHNILYILWKIKQSMRIILQFVLVFLW